MSDTAHPYLSRPGPKLLLINNQWVPALDGRTFKSINPSTGLVLAEIALAGAADVDVAVKAARAALEGPWARVKPAERQRVLLRLAQLVDQNFEELAWLDSLDMGAPISRTKAGRQRAVGMLNYYAGLAINLTGDTIPNSIAGEVFSYTVKEPVGVVGSIIPWNGPLSTSIWKIAPALATGCTIVLKPSEEACLTPLRLGELLMEAGLPPGVINILPGDGQAGAALSEHPDVDKVAFTGSTVTGQRIIRASAGNIKRLTLELGGKSPDIVFADANLNIAIAGAGNAAFQNSGQVCSAGTRLFVQRPIYEEFSERLAKFANSLVVGDSMQKETQLGPLVSARQLERVTGYLKDGKQDGARAVCGGERVTQGQLANGYFVRPTVLADVRESMSVYQEEIFGPVISMMPFDTIDEVIARANATTYGLGSGVWTEDLRTAHRMSSSLKAGSVWVNCYQAMDPAIPFGGYKRSGYGRESGRHHVDEYLNVKAVVMKIG